MFITRIAAIVAAGVAGNALAELKTFTQSSGDFNVSGNWTPFGVPDADDRIIIPAGKTCNVTEDADVDSLVIEEDGNLFIGSDVTLTLDNNNHNCPSPGPSCQSAPQHSIVDGTIDIVGDDIAGDSVLKIVNATHEFTGSGRIFGNKGPDLSRIEIGTNLTLVNKLTGTDAGIRGGMTILGLTGGSRGILRKEGVVSTSAALVFGTDDDMVIDAAIEDTDEGVWLTDCTGVMEFIDGSTSMKGLFTDEFTAYSGITGFSGGTFKFHEDVRTCGDYNRDGCGGIDVESSAVFQYSGFSGGCGNPGSGPTTITPNACESDDFYEIDEDVEEDCGE